MIEATSVILSVREEVFPKAVEDTFYTEHDFVLFSYQLGMYLTYDFGLSRYLMDAWRFTENEDAQKVADGLSEFIKKNNSFNFKITR